MLYLNDTVSFLRAEGHPQAHHYPIWRLWEEAKVARRRCNRERRTTATIMLLAASTSKASPKKAKEAVKKFNEFLTEHFDDGDEDN